MSGRNLGRRCIRRSRSIVAEVVQRKLAGWAAQAAAPKTQAASSPGLGPIVRQALADLLLIKQIGTIEDHLVNPFNLSRGLFQCRKPLLRSRPRASA